MSNNITMSLHKAETSIKNLFTFIFKMLYMSTNNNRRQYPAKINTPTIHGSFCHTLSKSLFGDDTIVQGPYYEYMFTNQLKPRRIDVVNSETHDVLHHVTGTEDFFQFLN